MQYDRLTTGLAVVLGGLTVVLTVVGLVESPAVLVLASTFGAATYFVYYHASGRMANRVYRRVERQARVDGGRQRRTGAGPREEWEPPRDGASARRAGGGARARQTGGSRRQRGQRQRRERRARAPSASDEISATEAYSRLGLDPGADQSSVKAAYRQKVKEVHPDTDSGDEQSFKRVKEAYERLND
ncbi:MULTISPECIES: J domain-containing protein [Halomicrobium]|uniref:Heat shock protein DnaJ domain protein n=2 Tax=Halomicrobium mukohataei TaxID=57705 RepID=C7P497_HALMD|nr:MULTISPECIES: J domain-containing protein [Halomicrobium]ACV47919.1 heat shock protein DnaJ domain protein [Halomicrobium mukohataei DSM 12286]QCD66357.1 J domain-containing protein [Halomicrobium mukohataei]QFR21162.1 DnaJ domain-containing protein [Halomicrobium sp. ZPS1]